MSYLQLDAVSRSYGPVHALDSVTLAVERGSRTAIVGPSGSGKTTLLRLVAGFEAPDAGRITLAGELLADGPAATPAHRRGVGVVMQDGALFPHLDVAGNIGFGIVGESGRAHRIAELMRMVELDPALARRRPDALSGGQQQRVALARALARRPRLILLDEPFSALDTGLRASTRKAVADLLSAAGITSILVTHDQAEALSFADQVAVMDAGRLLQVGTPRALYEHPSTPMVASFVGDAILLDATLAAGIASTSLGPLPVASTASGPARLMLRPEQVHLGAQGVPAEVTEVEFAGGACLVTVRLAGGLDLALRQPGLGAPAPGALVHIGVTGTAHVFEA
ncbi:MAG TPA: ABC transporter ATP-binding protein [Acetobacteraceae bacterium]|jgi:iron(III) transport system ATP-binding protein|nr:ABC transporter ATP-binding protein [Acetobacteraceae bacterium]